MNEEQKMFECRKTSTTTLSANIKENKIDEKKTKSVCYINLLTK